MNALQQKIESTRGYLNFLLEESNNPLDPYIISVSQQLDTLIHFYYGKLSEA